jgi:formylglycine-generating enzyme required for sulfatase activity
MVKVGDFWVDIYLSSEDGTAWPDTIPLSRFNATPLTGTEGYAYVDYFQLARNAGKRLPTYAEFLQYAYGVPEGAVGGSSRVATGSVAWLVSSLNVDQPSGNLWQVGADFMVVGEDNSWEWYEWTKSGKDSAQETGSIYQQTADMLRQLIFGGDWGYGANAGARCVALNNPPRYVSPYVGLRCVCDSL